MGGRRGRGLSHLAPVEADPPGGLDLEDHPPGRVEEVGEARLTLLVIRAQSGGQSRIEPGSRRLVLVHRATALVGHRAVPPQRGSGAAYADGDAGVTLDGGDALARPHRGQPETIVTKYEA